MNDSLNQAEMQAKVDNQVEILKKVFSEIDKNADEQIDQAELLDFLEKKGGKDINMDTFKKLFKTLDINEDGNITISEFIKCYLKIIGELEVSIQENNKLLDEYIAEEAGINRELNKYIGKEKFNNEGLSHDAHLISELSRIEIQDNKNSFSSIEVKIMLDNKSALLKPIKKEGKDFIYDQSQEL